MADYQSTNASHFEVNKDVMIETIKFAKKDLLKKKIAMVQADVMGHSMGGVLSRIHYQGEMWDEETPYKQGTNYNMGDIHKLITLDSVHFGSFLADFAIDLKDSLPPLMQNLFLSKMRSEGMPVDDGAVEDLIKQFPVALLRGFHPRKSLRNLGFLKSRIPLRYLVALLRGGSLS